MAKRDGDRRNKEADEPKEDEDYEFVPPDFDEDAFIHKEMVSFKTTSTMIVAGILAGVVSWLIFTPVGGEDAGWWAGLAVLALTFAALKPLYRLLGFDISHYGRREWIGSAFLLFFTWLAFFLILLNPPFSDHADPTLDVYVSPGAVQTGDEVRIDVFAADNDEVADLSFELTGPDGVVMTFDDLDGDRHHARTTRTLDAGSYSYNATARDVNGRESHVEGMILVREQVLDIRIGDLTDPTDNVYVRIPADTGIEVDDIYAVYAELDSVDQDGQPVRVYLEYEEKVGGWIATSNFEGWRAGTNNFTIVVEEKNQFQGQVLVRGGTLTAGPYEVEVSSVGDYDGGEPDRPQRVVAKSRQVPGIGLPLLVVGVVAVAWIVRRRS